MSLRIRKMLSLATAALVLIALVACGKKEAPGTGGTSAAEPQKTENETAAEPRKTESTPAAEPQKTDGASDVGPQGTDIAPETPFDGTIFVDGPYGRITAHVPDNWTWKACHVDEEGLIYGLYGLTMTPAQATEGQLDLFCSDSFGVCGTGLVQEEGTLAGGRAVYGTYDEHEHWDYIIYGENTPDKTACQIVAQHSDCSSWTPEMWDEAAQILDTMQFDPSLAEGGIGQFIRESENDEIGIIMEVRYVNAGGAIVHFQQYDRRDTGELIYGQGFSLEKKNGESWEPVPTIIEDYAFTEEGYIIPPEGESEIETDWSWIYGGLAPGTYRIRKTVIDHRDSGNKEYVLYAQFLIAGRGEPSGTGAAAGSAGSTEPSAAAGSDFDVSDPKWNRIEWDADGDGEKEELCFEYNDLGDEAPSYIEVTLYKGSDELTEMIDRAYGLKQITEEEDSDGKYLLVVYEMGDYYSHDAEGQCTIRLRDGKLEIRSLSGDS